jgi:predicted DNA-binding transcriptional regulator YafY
VTDGRFRVIPGILPRRRSKPHWLVGRDENGGIRYLLTAYSRAPRRWLSEEKANAACVAAQRLYDEHRAAQERAEQLRAQRGNAPPSWPFPVSAHGWSA